MNPTSPTDSMPSFNRLLDILRCPETGAALTALGDENLEELNRGIRADRLRDISGEPVRDELHGALQPEGAEFVYPVRGGVPNFLLEDRILLVDSNS